jgi:predicted metal-dependent phosphoesterase TrpH
VIKVDLHIHTGDDPVDRIPYSTTELIDRAAALGFGALAITLHERQLDLRDFGPVAADRGVALIPGIERTIEGKHVLLINFSAAAESVGTFEELTRLKASEPGLVIAPHPFFPTPSCLGRALERHADLFDAVEYNAMFTRHLNFNERAVRWAQAHGKPLVGNGDVHRLRQLGTTWSIVDAPADPAAICAAIAAGRVSYQATPLSWGAAAGIMADLLAWRSLGGSRGRPTPASDSTNISLRQNA